MRAPALAATAAQVATLATSPFPTAATSQPACCSTVMSTVISPTDSLLNLSVVVVAPVEARSVVNSAAAARLLLTRGSALVEAVVLAVLLATSLFPTQLHQFARLEITPAASWPNPSVVVAVAVEAPSIFKQLEALENRSPSLAA